MNARPNNNQLITYFIHVRYLLRIQQYPVNNTYNKDYAQAFTILTTLPLYAHDIPFQISNQCFGVTP